MSSLVIYRSSGSSESISSSGGESSDDGGSGSDDVDVTRVVNMEAITDPSGNANQDSGRNHKGETQSRRVTEILGRDGDGFGFFGEGFAEPAEALLSSRWCPTTFVRLDA